MLPRLIRIINVSIAVLIVLIAIAIYWYAFRPLPKVSGEISAPVNAPATIERDARGVPHIEAGSWQGAIFLQGYATAQDRLWQMDGLRRFGAGELAEVFGPSALPSDERSRRMRMRAIAEAAVLKLTPGERSAMVEYARGVNYFIDTHRGDYSLEFSMPGFAYDPRPWTLADSVLVGLVMYRDLTDKSQFMLEKSQFLAKAKNPAHARLLFPAIEGQYVRPGSNAWAVSGAHSADEKPMAANDPHLAYGIPGTWHLVQLKAPGLDVSGAALPGLPGVITGHNSQIAWGVTNLQSDVMDLYLEQIDERTGRYVFQGKPEQAQLDRQFIGVHGQKPEQMDVWITRHGPLIAHENGKSYSMRWTAAEGFSYPFFEIDRAQNWDQFRSAVSSFWGPPQNFIYADRAGNIGYQAAGRVPIRNFDSDLPLDGASGNFEWSGYIPFEQMPMFSNPPSGIVATANQDPFPPNYPFHVDGDYADKYRVDQIRALLNAKPKLTVDDMLAIQKDVYSAFDYFLAQQAIAASTRHARGDELTRAAIELLRHWNGQMDKDEAAPMITELFRDELGRELVISNSNFANIRPRPQVIETLLRDRPSGWVAKDDWDTWLMQTFNAALAVGRNRQGSRVSNWRWGRVLEWKLAHPIGKSLPIVNRFFDIGPIPMSGAGTTVKQTTATLGPSERMVVDLGDLDRSVQNLVTGESGYVASAHYKDEWQAYYTGKSFPMQFDHVEAKDTLRVKPQ